MANILIDPLQWAREHNDFYVKVNNITLADWFLGTLWRTGSHGGRTAPENLAGQAHEDAASQAGGRDGSGGVVITEVFAIVSCLVDVLPSTQQGRR